MPAGNFHRRCFALATFIAAALLLTSCQTASVNETYKNKTGAAAKYFVVEIGIWDYAWPGVSEWYDNNAAQVVDLNEVDANYNYYRLIFTVNAGDGAKVHIGGTLKPTTVNGVTFDKYYLKFRNEEFTDTNPNPPQLAGAPQSTRLRASVLPQFASLSFNLVPSGGQYNLTVTNATSSISTSLDALQWAGSSQPVSIDSLSWGVHQVDALTWASPSGGPSLPAILPAGSSLTFSVPISSVTGAYKLLRWKCSPPGSGGATDREGMSIASGTVAVPALSTALLILVALGLSAMGYVALRKRPRASEAAS